MYLNIKSGSIYYQKVGSASVKTSADEQRKDLIMLHGWKQDVSTFWPILDLLKDQFTIWLIDLPGFGRSDLPKDGLSVLDYAKTIKEFVEEQKIKQPILLGHSLGGRVGIKFASHYPELIDKLILEDAAGIKPPQDGIKPLIFVGAKIFKILVPDIFGLKSKLRHTLYRSLGSDYLEAGELTNTLKNILAEDLTPDLLKIKAETLIIWGENDRAVPLKYGKKMYRLIPNSKFEMIEGVSHFPHLENPEKFVYFVKDFLS